MNRFGLDGAKAHRANIITMMERLGKLSLSHKRYMHRYIQSKPLSNDISRNSYDQMFGTNGKLISDKLIK